MTSKPSEMHNACREENTRKPSRNRFELWLRLRRANGFLLLLGIVLLLFARDRILAFGLALAALRERRLRRRHKRQRVQGGAANRVTPTTAIFWLKAIKLWPIKYLPSYGAASCCRSRAG
jgi:hypothetical protein